MGVLGRLLRRRVDRRRGVLAVDPVEGRDEAPAVPRPSHTAGTAPLRRPDPTPSMRVPGAKRTAGTREYRFPGGTPSTERLHNPRRPGR